MILQCYPLLKSIEHRPAMWTGEMTLKSMHVYIRGYYRALLEHKIVEDREINEPFFDWIADKLGYSSSTAGWANMILAHCMGFDPEEILWETYLATPVTNEQHTQSVKLFYELLEEFKTETEQKNKSFEF